MITPEEKASLILGLRQRLQYARETPSDLIAGEVRRLGFGCISCGECCRGPDNSVAVFPSEIRRIMEATGEEWNDVAEPPDSGEWDKDGCFHTLEWRLAKSEGACRYYDDDRGACLIYAVRPILCRTYPLYIDEGVIRVSECRGLGGEMGGKEALELAKTLLQRYVTELEEGIALTERYEDFERGDGLMPNEDMEDDGARGCAMSEGRIRDDSMHHDGMQNRTVIVHDSEGCRRLPLRHDKGSARDSP